MKMKTIKNVINTTMIVVFCSLVLTACPAVSPGDSDNNPTTHSDPYEYVPNCPFNTERNC